MMHAKQPYSDIKTLAELIAALAPYEGSFELRLRGVHAIRVSHANEELTHYVQRSSLCIIAQGRKVAMIGDATYGCEAGDIALYSIDVPVASRVTHASSSEPYLVLMLDLDPTKIAELSLKVFPHGIPQARETRALKVAKADAYIIDRDATLGADGAAERRCAARAARGRRDSHPCAQKPGRKPAGARWTGRVGRRPDCERGGLSAR
jgi:hypothetical protein